MTYRKSALMLIGSPRLTKSNSSSLADYLDRQLQEKYIQTNRIFLLSALKSNDSIIDLFTSVKIAQVIILISPLYCSSLPYIVTKSMELIHGCRTSPNLPNQQFYALLNCGFPEFHHNHTGIAICRLFARESGFIWSGGLGLGMGETIGAKSLDKAGYLFKNVMKSLDLTSQAIAEGKEIPSEAVSLMQKPVLPKFIYKFVAHYNWKRQAKIHGARNKLSDRPLL
ncbi:MAG: hypothetical protein A2Y62_02970 [Candidatus Fischerbacteria bacterium RBG_13_37_8]|uniref:NADPH-dependent FMN reductase-like domain-containing protein n=1 Tax=Candidatus Fischerbacteria bacterium RBG_13_37_8 TaxID=1817863 RepID=A0A1F5VFF8_9BACT|nr:MAG: hypothetical protein A2Y62_02970 [Candidatus Fischerbacteria bacterium RBG_13_37_8]